MKHAFMSMGTGVKYLSKNKVLKCLSSFGGICTLSVLLLHYIPQENNVLFTPYIFPDIQKLLLHFECLAGQKNCPIQENIPGHPYYRSCVRLTKHTCFVCKLC